MKIDDKRFVCLGDCGYGDFGVDLIGSAVNGIHFRSNYLPDIDVDMTTPSSGAALTMSDKLLKSLQPMVTIDTNFGPVEYAPFGKPGPTRWGTFALTTGVVGLAVLGFAAYGAYKLIEQR